MTEEQMPLFIPGRTGRGSAGEKTRPIAAIPTELDSESSLAAAMGAFHGHMMRQGFSDNTIKAFLADLRLLGKYVGRTSRSARSARPTSSNSSPGCGPTGECRAARRASRAG